jgi:hypothetical protein
MSIGKIPPFFILPPPFSQVQRGYPGIMVYQSLEEIVRWKPYSGFLEIHLLCLSAYWKTRFAPSETIDISNFVFPPYGYPEHFVAASFAEKINRETSLPLFPEIDQTPTSLSIPTPVSSAATNNYKKSMPQISETHFRYVFAHQDDSNREMILSFLVFDVPE